MNSLNLCFFILIRPGFLFKDHIKTHQITSQSLHTQNSVIQLAAVNTQLSELSLHPNPPCFILPCRGMGKACENRLADSKHSM